MTIERISAVTLATADMSRAFDFYSKLGFRLSYGGPDADFTSFHVAESFLNIAARPGYAGAGPWGRTIFHVSDVDEMFAKVRSAGLSPETEPRDASWGERYFHILDPDGHELSFAKPL